ncbi:MULTISPECIES: helix-turn-helix domain-containing protein [Micromonospora]|uniref:Putative DNA-binding domain-containing protein n=1 Tax=Micromonospora citrea TaxID=47855 RepID=A0A1C6VVP8_9ACTN|nr:MULTISPECIES: ATP-binding protein [Micromonospora]SCL70375.1 Putative DNA-binding domain-containing protein [Micromonospora citrea]
MPTLRNRRLEQLLGGPIDETLTYKQVKGLIPDTTEGPDLDFKRDTYGSRDKDRKELCADVGGLANANGGLLILGMEEDSQGRATKDVGVDISDAERVRLHQTVVANVQPTPTFDIIPVEDPDRPGTGFLVIWVARTATAPHAYIQNNSLLYPKRIGTQRAWLSEALVAEAYRARFAGFADRIDEAARIEADFVERLAPDETFVVVTLVPDMPGVFTIDTPALRAFGLSNADTTHTAFGIGVRHFIRSTVRRRCLVGATRYQPNKPYSRGACELHESGSGVFSSAVDVRTSGVEDLTSRLVDDQWLTLGIAAGLRFLARHARDRAAAGGLATVRAAIAPYVPAALVDTLGWPEDRLGWFAAQALATGKGGEITNGAWADTVADIDDLCADGPGLVAATYRLTSELFQAFGAPEVRQITADGGIRLPHWHQQIRPTINRWAQAAGVEVLTQPLAQPLI